MRYLLQFLYVVLAVIIIKGRSYGQDPGLPDSLIIGSISVDIGDTIANVPVFGVTDDPVAFFNTPLSITAPEGGFHFQAVAVVSGPLTQWDEIFADFVETDQFLRLFGIWDTGGDDNPPLQTDYQRAHLLDLIFLIDPGTPDQYVTLENALDPIGGELLFGLEDGLTEFAPAFLPGVIRYGNPTGIYPDAELPNVLSLEQNYPNPFNPQTNIGFHLPAKALVRLDIFNLLGQRVRRLADGFMEPGFHAVLWDGRDDGGTDLPSGIYFYALNAGRDFATAKMVLIR